VKQGIPSQAEHNPDSPEEHFLWALRNLPTVGAVGAVTHSGFLRAWSKHLWKLGFRHRDWLANLADADGNIHVSKLPKQELKFQPAFRGPGHQYNNAAQWVRHDAPEPKPFVVPNIAQLTQQEQYALAIQLDQAGIRLPKELQRDTAAVEGN